MAVMHGSGLFAVANPLPFFLEQTPEKVKVDAEIVRESDGQGGTLKFSDKQQLSKIYVANGGVKSVFEKQEEARLQKVVSTPACRLHR